MALNQVNLGRVERRSIDRRHAAANQPSIHDHKAANYDEVKEDACIDDTSN